LKSCRVLQDHYDNERDVDRVSQHNTRLQVQDQDQDRSVQDQDQDRIFFGLRPVLS